MLRSIVIAVGVAALAGGLLALQAGTFPPAFIFVFWGGLIVVGTLYERFRYKPLDDHKPGPGWEATSERFIDDETGKPVTVFIERRTGERKYVSD